MYKEASRKENRGPGQLEGDSSDQSEKIVGYRSSTVNFRDQKNWYLGSRGSSGRHCSVSAIELKGKLSCRHWPKGLALAQLTKDQRMGRPEE